MLNQKLESHSQTEHTEHLELQITVLNKLVLNLYLNLLNYYCVDFDKVQRVGAGESLYNS